MEKTDSFMLAKVRQGNAILPINTAELEITRKLVEAGKLLGIELVAHIIYAPATFYSFREHGML